MKVEAGGAAEDGATGAAEEGATVVEALTETELTAEVVGAGIIEVQLPAAEYETVCGTAHVEVPELYVASYLVVKVHVEAGAEDAVTVALVGAAEDQAEASLVQTEVQAPLGPVKVYAQSATARDRREAMANVVFILLICGFERVWDFVLNGFRI